MNSARRLLLLLTFAAAALASRPALAADCSTIKPGNPIVYVTGTAKPYVASLARVLFADPTAPVTVVYQGMSSCIAWDAVLNGTPISGTASYWDPSMGTMDEVSCTLPGTDAGTGIVADMGVADIFASTCISLPNGLPADVGDFFGPVQTMTFVVPKGSPEKSISATAAYVVYGFGGSGPGVSPWTNPANILRLDDQSGTQRLIAAGIGVSPTLWKGNNQVFSAALISTITSVSPADAPSTLGILAATNIVGNVPTSLNVLAYKHYGQSCGYYPDSSPSAKDKVNVRDGHYALWGPVHFMSRIANGYPVNSNVKRLISYWTGTAAPPSGVDFIQVDALNNLVPTCAMRVQRTTEMGPLTSFPPPNACGCYFESQAGTTSCKTCTTAKDCPSSAPVCSFGYCERP